MQKTFNIFIGPNAYSTEWENKQVTWQGLKRLLLAEPRRTNEKQGTGFVGGKFKTDGRRVKDNFESRSLLTIDIDNVGPDFDARALVEPLGLKTIAYTSFSHTESAPRWRIIIPLDRDIDGPLYKALYAAISEELFNGIELDPVGGEPNQFMFYGFTKRNAPYDSFTTRGDYLKVNDYYEAIQRHVTQETSRDTSHNHAHEETGYKGVFNRGIGSIENTLNEYETPLYISGHEVRLEGYNRKAGDYYPSDDHIYFRKTDLDIVLDTGRQSFDAFGIVCYYQFNDDPAAMADHVRERFGPVQGTKKELHFDLEKEFGDVLQPADETGACLNLSKSIVTDKVSRCKENYTLKGLPWELYAPLNEKGKPLFIPAELAKWAVDILHIKKKNGQLFKYDPLTFVYRQYDEDAIYKDFLDAWSRPIKSQWDMYPQMLRSLAPVMDARNLFEQPKYIAVKNGVLKIDRTGSDKHELLPGSPDFDLTEALDVEFNPDITKNEQVEQAYNDWSDGNEDIKQTMFELVAIGLGLVKAREAVFFIIGSPGSGKSTFARSQISEIVGRENRVDKSIHDFDKHFGLDRLNGKPLVFCGDMPQGIIGHNAVGLVKSITGGDPFTADIKFEREQQIFFDGCMLFVSNYEPSVSKADLAFLDRCFPIYIDKRRRDTGSDDPLLERKLSTDAAKSYTLNRALSMVSDMANNRHGVTINATLRTKREKLYRELNDIGRWWYSDGKPMFEELMERGVTKIPVNYAYNAFVRFNDYETKFKPLGFKKGLTDVIRTDGFYCSDDDRNTHNVKDRARIPENEWDTLQEYELNKQTGYTNGDTLTSDDLQANELEEKERARSFKPVSHKNTVFFYRVNDN